MDRVIECVPNFSEGRDTEVIRRITSQIETVEGVKLLDVDPGRATNRTVVTLAGSPEAVIESAMRAIRVATELIDMRKHHGEHPRFGATDVCPLVPVSGVTMEETVRYAHELARRLGEELGLTIFCYENAATRPERRNLADVREGEYEGLAARLADPKWHPDFGPAGFNARSGATAVGARDFLVAYNVNLNTTSTRRANAVAFDVRERGRIRRDGDPVTGEIVRDGDGEPVWDSGSLQAVKAIGWYLDDYGIAQVSMNLTNTSVTPIHIAFDEVSERARDRGLRVTGSEIVGLVPLQAMLDAGRHFLRKQQRSTGVPDAELIRIAIRSMGLEELGEFDPAQKIIEYRLEQQGGNRLVDMALGGFIEETASESPAPGGGSVAAAVGSLGAALATMVANLSSHRRGWDERWEEFSEWAERGKRCHTRLAALVDRDTEAFNALLDAYRLPATNAEEKQLRESEIRAATVNAIETPLEVMRTAADSMGTIRAMAEIGQETSVSDAGVAALCARAAVRGAHLNVLINVRDLDDPDAVAAFVAEAGDLAAQAERAEAEILAIVADKL